MNSLMDRSCHEYSATFIPGNIKPVALYYFCIQALSAKKGNTPAMELI